MGLKRWQIKGHENSNVAAFTDAVGVGSLVAKVLLARGYDTASAAAFLQGDGELYDPFLLKGMDRAVARIREAVGAGETIAIFGDYDCDGITATAMLHSYFEMIGAKVYYHIPRRDKEGYGLNNGAIADLQGLGVSLIITVDNGISAVDEVAYAASLGVDVIVTDHHQPPAVLPDAVALINPHQVDCPYPHKDLSGVGVAFKLISALEDDLGYETLEHYSDLVTIGTVADVVSLTGENRLFVKHGLLSLAEGIRPGVEALIARCGLTGKRLTSESVAFAIAPRINAAGRVSEPDLAAMLFLTDRSSEAEELCEQLDAFNEARKENEKATSDEIAAMIENDPDILTRRTITLYKDGWNSGTVGIVCSRIVERYEKPCILIAIEGDEAKGSGRSLPGFSLIDAITDCAPLLTRFGGHVLAAGFTLPTANLEAFVAAIEHYAAEHHPVMPVSCLSVDGELSVEDLSLVNVEQLERLEPYGAGNTLPLFVLRKARIVRIMPTADGRHLRLALMRNGRELTAVYFGVGLAQFPYCVDDEIDIAFHTDINLWNDKKSLNIKLRDVRLSGVDADALIEDREVYMRHVRGERIAEEHLPDRDDIALVYRFIRAAGALADDRDYLASKLSLSGLSYTKSALALDVVRDLDLVESVPSERGQVLKLKPVSAKVDLESSPILRRHRTPTVVV